MESASNFDQSIPPLLQRVYRQRGVTEQQSLELELAGLPSPHQMKGISTAVDLLCETLDNGQRITVVGDFDADGATSSALAIHALRAMGFDCDFLVPNRFEYGYGLTPEIVAEAQQQQQPDLIITVDNGISSHSGVEQANKLGVKVIVTDHHLPGEDLPAAAAIVNPNQPGCEFPTKNLAGVGVIFYLLSALRSRLREQNYFVEHKLDEPNLADYLDLVALGTVADVVPLDFYNRIFVEQGLRRIRAGRTRPGITALIDVARRQQQRLVSSDLAFSLAPRLNAAGRMDDMSTGIHCLLTENITEARLAASELDELNRDRRTIEQGMKEEAIKDLDNLHLDNEQLPWGLCVYDENWHQGVVGILASRLKERYHRPVIAFAPVGNGEIKGSARSIPGFHIRDALDAIATQNPGVLDKFGGHAMAAGLTLCLEQQQTFFELFDVYTREQLTEQDLSAELYSDGELTSDEFNLPLAQQLRHAGPWGQQFPEPTFDGVFTVINRRVVGAKHLKLVLQPDGETQTVVDAIAFNMETYWLEELQTGEQIRALYKLDVNEYRGIESVQLIVDYLEKYLSS